jgi:dihydroxy-acid dehydratase
VARECPEWGHIPIPQKLLDQGIHDVLRISDARMSGTSFGTIVLHIAPETAIGGPFAVVQDGDFIELDIDKHLIHVDLADEIIRERLEKWKAPELFLSSGAMEKYSLTIFSRQIRVVISKY